MLNNYGGLHIDRGIQVSIHAPRINHIPFADDSLIFLTAKTPSAERLTDIHRIYDDCSGQAVKREKSSIYFSGNTTLPRRESLKQTLGISVEAFSECYLGLPTDIG